MAITRVINVDVNTGDANAELEKLEGSFKEVDKAAEKTNKSVDDVAGNGGAIAILDQLTGGLATRFKDAFEASKLFNGSLKATRGALIATGIGALVVALGLVVAYWDDIVGYITDANGKLEEQQTLIESTGTLLDAQLATINKKLELNKLEGKANEELEKQRVAILKRIQEQSVALREKLEEQLLNLKATKTEVGFWDTIKANILFATLGTKALASEAASLAAQRLNEIKDLEAAIETQKLKEIDLAIQLYNAENTGSTDGTKRGGEVESLDSGLTPEDIKLLDSKVILNEMLTEFDQEFIDAAGDRAEAQYKNEIKWAELAAEQKLAIAGSVLRDAAQLVDQNSVAGKGIAIAQTGINTAQGIMQAFATLPTIAAIPAAAIVGALGIKQTLEIAKRKIPSATGRGFVSGGASGGGPGGTSAPSFNLISGTAENQVAESINTQQEPVQAYVVSGDVTTAQNLDNNIVTESGI